MTLPFQVARRATLQTDVLEHSDEIIAETLNSAKPGWAERLHPKWLPIGFDLVILIMFTLHVASYVIQILQETIEK